jgi:Contractile injection system tube protein
MGLSLFKLEKLKIKAYETKGRGGFPVKTFEAMFNPSSFKQSYQIIWGNKDRQGYNSSGLEAEYTRSKPERLDIDLLLDGTGVDQMGIVSLVGGAKSVSDRVKDFLDATFRYNGNIHEPNFLVVEWGSLIFSCRLESVDITYNSFDRDGTPLRAELKATFISDKEAKRLAKEENKKSPDLTHSRIVRAGDTLPLLTNAVYGSSAYCLDVARFNQLDNFRSLTPGQQILFPPLESLTERN